VTTNFAETLRQMIRTDMNNYADDMAVGALQDFAQYQKLCGVIQGLAIAERYLMDLLKKAENDDD